MSGCPLNFINFNLVRSIQIILFLFLCGRLLGQEEGLPSVAEAFQIISPENNTPEPIAEAMLDLSRDYRNIDLEFAKELLDSALAYTRTHGLRLQEARGLTQRAIIANIENRKDVQAESYQSAIDIYKSELDNVNDSIAELLYQNISSCYNNQAGTYLEMGQYSQALEFYLYSLEALKDPTDSLSFSIRYYNISDAYLRLGNADSARKYILQSKTLEEGMLSDEGLAYAYEGLAKVDELEHRYDEALDNINTARDYIANARSPFFETDILTIRARILVSKNEIANALEQYQEALKKATEIGYLKLVPKIYDRLIPLYEKTGNQTKALFYAIELLQLKDSLAEVSSDEKVAEFRVQFQTEQKDLKIAHLNEQNRLKEEQEVLKDSRNRIRFIGITAAAILFAVIGVLLWIGSRRRKRVNRFLARTNEHLSDKNAQIKRQSDQISDSITYARNIQNAFLPNLDEIQEVFENQFIFYQPRDVVSGDFYWMYRLENSNRVLVAVADCTGHGVPGAFMSIVGHSSLTKIIQQNEIDSPSEILKLLGQELYQSLRKGSGGVVKDGMDIALLCFDFEVKKIQFAGARNSLIVVSEGELKEFKGDRIDLGKSYEVGEVTEHIFDYKTGDTVYLFSDGFPDQKGEQSGKKYFMAPFRDLILKTAQEPINRQKDIFVQEFESWKGEGEQLDDVLIWSIKL